MSDCVGTSPFLRISVVMVETMHCHIAQTSLSFMTTCFRIHNSDKHLVSMKVCPGCKVGQISSKINYASVEKII